MINTCFGVNAPYKHFFKRKNLGAGRIHFDRAIKMEGAPWGLTHGVFITCCEEEKLANLKEGKAFRIKNGQLI